jgi:uncharacterized protein
VTFCDSSAAIALINRRDNNHARAVATLGTLTDLLVITSPCIAEAMHVLGSFDGWHGQSKLWSYLIDGLIEVHESTVTERLGMFELMEQYRDTPMDYGDASLVAAAEATNILHIFTFDHHFGIYRPQGSSNFHVIPG